MNVKPAQKILEHFLSTGKSSDKFSHQMVVSLKVKCFFIGFKKNMPVFVFFPPQIHLLKNDKNEITQAIKISSHQPTN